MTAHAQAVKSLFDGFFPFLTLFYPSGLDLKSNKNQTKFSES